jgi:hypothetical protein
MLSVLKLDIADHLVDLAAIPLPHARKAEASKLSLVRYKQRQAADLLRGMVRCATGHRR